MYVKTSKELHLASEDGFQLVVKMSHQLVVNHQLVSRHLNQPTLTRQLLALVAILGRGTRKLDQNVSELAKLLDSCVKKSKELLVTREDGFLLVAKMDHHLIVKSQLMAHHPSLAPPNRQILVLHRGLLKVEISNSSTRRVDHVASETVVPSVSIAKK